MLPKMLLQIHLDLTNLQKGNYVVQNRKYYSIAIYHISTISQMRLTVCSIFPRQIFK
jgi:hypothetical protein